jgi:hypothetical protein
MKRFQKSFERRGGRFEAAPSLSPETMLGFLDELLQCPECRAAVLEACNAEDHKDVDIDSAIRDLALSRHH